MSLHIEFFILRRLFVLHRGAVSVTEFRGCRPVAWGRS